MIRLAGVSVRRVCVPQLADRLVHAGHNQTASKILTGSSEQLRDVDLDPAECAQIVAVLQKDCPADLVELRVSLDAPPHRDDAPRSAAGLVQPEPA